MLHLPSASGCCLRGAGVSSDGELLYLPPQLAWGFSCHRAYVWTRKARFMYRAFDVAFSLTMRLAASSFAPVVTTATGISEVGCQACVHLYWCV